MENKEFKQKMTNYRWVIVGLLFISIVLSYIDRQTIGLLKGPISKEYGWSNSDFANIHICFQAAYAIFYLLWGRIIDRFGAKIGFSFALGIWSIAQISMAGASKLMHFGLARGFLGVGESGAFPAAIKAVVEWFPQKERALANGIFNSGSNIGAIITPLIVPMIALNYGWQAAFIFTGILGLIFLPIWYFIYNSPRAHKLINQAELNWIEQDGSQTIQEQNAKTSWFSLLKHKETWAYTLGKAFTDPIYGMYLVWLPDFLSKRYNLDLKTIAWPLIVIYLLSDFGSIFGGWLSSNLLKKGYSVNIARKLSFIICAICATPVMFAPSTSNLWVTVFIIGIAAAAHQGFSANLYAIPGDLLPKNKTASVAGLGGLFGAGMGILMSKYTGHMLDIGASYTPIFIVAGLSYWAAILAIHVMSPKLKPALIDA